MDIPSTQYIQVLHLEYPLKIGRVFFEMLDEILNYRVGFELFKYLFEGFGTEIVVISGVGNAELGSEEVFEEIISMLHFYSMNMYSKRRNHSIEICYGS